MLPPSIEKGGMSYNFYSLAANRVVSLKKKKSNPQSDSPKDDALIVGSSHGWLALYNRHDRSLFLSNPITGEHIRLPPIETLDFFSESIFRHEQKYGVVKRLILSSPPHQQDCRAIIFSDTRIMLAVCSPGRSSSWTTSDEWLYYPHKDAVYSTTYRRFFCLLSTYSTSYDLNGWDATDPSSPKDDDGITEWAMTFSYPDNEDDGDWPPRSKLDNKLKKIYGTWPMRHLVHVEHTGQLMLVKRYYVEQRGPDASDSDEYDRFYLHTTVDFHVYVLDPLETSVRYQRRRNLRYMEDSLDGLALFVGLNHSFALLAADYPELKPDSNFFTDGLDLTLPPAFDHDYVYGGHDIGIFDYKRKTISPCYYPCDIGSLKKIYPTPMWFTPSPH